jgi:hypothetical protein
MRYASPALPLKLRGLATMANVLITNLIPDPQKSEEEKLAIGDTPSQYPPMTNHMAKVRRETHRHPARITLLTDTNRIMLPLAIRPTCRHQSIRHSKSQKEELSYATTMANEGEAVMLDAETIRHDGKAAEMADPREGTGLAMTTARTVMAIKTSIAPLAITMTKGKAPAAMTTTHLHKDQKEVVVAAENSRRTARVSPGTILRHPHQVAPMAVAVVVADLQGRAALAKIRQTRSPTTPVHI